ncbi:LysM peptidoglycan-binding domain-containing protein [Bdellovibrio reynosensis]|uniref:LysM peptidoglycan-binding domain-containing protein n=1 Tax=Bdellovibrio reynosensis TaxID=2835041 RepID=A0ABY4C9V3_9BACT|nr:LysM peptidoglycan-binding domain-containing protein [Bdellovibrio reynosensis]UOF01653.1 LysM peptidoglycan-binding domain-containing protein [Bdellovibrio reynosensis]
MSKRLSMILAVMICLQMAQVQKVQAQDAPPDATWETDPLDVIEPEQKNAPAEPSVPEFKEIDETGSASQPAEPVPPTEIDAPAAEPTEVATPEAVPAPVETAVETAAQGDSPDFSKESEFHRIYKSYNEQPTSQEAWEQVAGPRASETYLVQKGDTLSGISTTFFGDYTYWPKVWSLNNPQILNPHEIEPGMMVQFFPGSMDDAPTMAVAEADAAAVNEPQEKEKAKKADKNEVNVGALPKGKKRAPLLKKLPPSLPQYRLGAVNEPLPTLEVELAKTQFPTALEYLEYFIADAPVEGVGVVTATELDTKTAGDYQHVYVRLPNNAGKEFVVQKNLAEVKDPETKKRKGFMIELQGEIEVIEPVNEQKNLYRALVKKTIQPVAVGSVLIPGRLPMIDPTIGSLTTGVGAKIMGGQFEAKRSLFGSHSFVFLDSGSSQGIQEGMALPVFADERVRNKKNDAVINDRVIGAAKVVRVAPNFATAYIVKATDDILLGDYVGKPTARVALEPEVIEAPKKEDDDFEKDFEDAPQEEAPSDSGEEDLDLEIE